MRKFIEISQARDILLANTDILGKESVGLDESLGRITALDIKAPLSMPNFRKSPFDGYCMLSKDTKGASPSKPIKLEVNGVLQAGKGICSLVPGIYKIMTGAQVPDFCDCVIKKEDTDNGRDIVAIYKELASGENIIEIGEDVFKGDKIASSGKKVTPGMQAMISSMGMDKIMVYKMPKVGLITTGDEVIEPGEPLEIGKVYNSNRYAIMGYLRELRVEANYYGTAVDNKEKLAMKFNEALSNNDILITTGGVSVGDYDLIQDVYDSIGIKKLFWGVQMKPGTPVLAGIRDNKIIISLPGSPAASLITFEVLVSPVIRKLKGLEKYLKTEYQGEMLDDFNKIADMPRFLRVKAQRGPQGYLLSLSGKQNASVLHSMVNFNALALVETLGIKVAKGDLLKFTFNDEDEL